MTPRERAIEAWNLLTQVLSVAFHPGDGEANVRARMELRKELEPFAAHVLAEMRKAETSGSGTGGLSADPGTSTGVSGEGRTKEPEHRTAPQRVPEDCGFSTDALHLARNWLDAQSQVVASNRHSVNCWCLRCILARYVVRLHESASPPPAPASGGDERRWWLVPNDDTWADAYSTFEVAQAQADNRASLSAYPDVIEVVPASRAASAERERDEYRTTARQLDETARVFKGERDAALARVREMEKALREMVAAAEEYRRSGHGTEDERYCDAIEASEQLLRALPLSSEEEPKP